MSETTREGEPIPLTTLAPISIGGESFLREVARATVKVVLLLVVAGVFVGGWMVYRGIKVSLQAEETLQATRLALRAVEQFVRENSRWPKSWEELGTIKRDPGTFPTKDMVGYLWPEDWPAALPRVRQRVAIDFEADLTALAMEDPFELVAVKPVGPHYKVYDGELQSLHSAIHAAVFRKRLMEGNQKSLPAGTAR
jgi:hypothetical protein